MENVMLSIVILNYNNYTDTIKCIESIRHQTFKNYKIIIVDNASINESIEKLNIYLKDKKEIILLKNKENLGFAKGNNTGIKYALEKLSSKFIFILNNDTVLNNKNSLEEIMRSYKPGIAIINPSCINLDGRIQAPYCISNGNLFLDFIKTIMVIIWQAIKAFLPINYSFHKSIANRYDTEFEKNNYVIQGNAYVLTPDFFNFYTQLFPNTFLYLEEEALKIYVIKAKLKTVYLKNINIIHTEGGSSKSINKTNKALMRIKSKYALQSFFRMIPILFMNCNQIKSKYS